jgi:MFS family permease
MAELRRARVGVCVIFAVCGAAFATWAARVPAAQERLGLSPGQLAVALFGLAAGSVVALAGAGLLLARIGSRASALTGSALLCLGLPLVSLAASLPLLVATLFLLGMGNSLLDVSMNAHAARVEAGYGRSIFAGFHAFWSIGGLAGSGLSGLLAARHVPITVQFPLTGLVLLAAAWWVIATCFLRGADQGQGQAGLARPSRTLLPLGIIAFCGFVAEGTVNDWSAVYLNHTDAASAAVASLGYFAFSIAMIVVRLVADRIGERIGVTRLLRAAVLVAVSGFALVMAVTRPAAGIVGFGIVGLGVAAIVPLAWSAAGRRQPGSPGPAISAVATLGYLGFLLGPVLIGGLASLIGLRLALAGAVAVTLVIYLLAPALSAPAASGPASPRLLGSP